MGDDVDSLVGKLEGNTAEANPMRLYEGKSGGRTCLVKDTL